MKKLTLLTICLCAPLLMANTGCSSSNPSQSVPLINGQSVNQTVPASVSNGAKKSLTAAHQAYNAVGMEILNATKAGLIKGNTATTVKTYYDKAGDALNAADTAEKLANESNLLAAVAEANTFMGQATTVVSAGGN